MASGATRYVPIHDKLKSQSRYPAASAKEKFPMFCLKIVKMLIAGCLYTEHESTAIPTITLPCARAKK